MQRVGLCVIWIFWSSLAVAQVSALPQHVQDMLDETGPKWNQDRRGSAAKTWEVFTALHRTIPDGDLTVHSDIAYGNHPLQRFDIYRSEETSNAPILIYMHGGAYVRGARNANEEIAANIPRFFARNGILALNIDYRLAPDAPWPEAVKDLGTVVEWVQENGSRFGGDSDRIFLMGSSAGATHIATYTYNGSLHPEEGPGVVGIILVSGRYRIAPRPDAPNFAAVQAYFGSDPALYPERSAITHVADSPGIPAYVVISEYENTDLDVSGAELFAALCKRDGVCPRFSRLERHNHLSSFFAINTADDYLGRQVLEFIRRGR